VKRHLPTTIGVQLVELGVEAGLEALEVFDGGLVPEAHVAPVQQLAPVQPELLSSLLVNRQIKTPIRPARTMKRTIAKITATVETI